MREIWLTSVGATLLLYGAICMSADFKSVGASQATRRVPSIEILSPQQGADIWNTGGRVEVSLTSENVSSDGPSLSNQRVAIQLDGQLASGSGVKSQHLTLTEVPRGTHTLVATLMEGDKVLARSATVTIYVHQHSILQPKPR